VPKRYQKLKIVICLVLGGDMQEQVRGALFLTIDRDEKTA